MTKICILDYGSGNTGSVYNLFRALKAPVEISRLEKDILEATHIVMPGVGSFQRAMKSIKTLLPMEILQYCVLNKKTPFLGICVGMQVLATTGEEFGLCEGLNWIPGRVIKLAADQLLLPHVGWNDLNIIRNPGLFNGLGENPDFYFVHSYHFCPISQEFCLAETAYGQPFCAVIQKDNITGVQFHPEKSQNAGKKLIANFLRIGS
jgi:glutamine amidotransferase